VIADSGVAARALIGNDAGKAVLFASLPVVPL
jgi:hypothetical protein